MTFLLSDVRRFFTSRTAFLAATLVSVFMVRSLSYWLVKVEKQVGNGGDLVAAAAAAAAATSAVSHDLLAFRRAEVLHFADGLLHIDLGGLSVHRFDLPWFVRLLLVSQPW
jgi:hypothetical protein